MYVAVSIFIFLFVGWVALMLGGFAEGDMEIMAVVSIGLLGVVIFLASQILGEVKEINKKLDGFKKDDDKKDTTKE